MRNYQIGMYEKAVPEEYSVPQMLSLAKEAGYDFFEISIDRTEERISRLYDEAYQRELLDAAVHIRMPIRSLCLSALGTYTLGNPDLSVENRAKEIGIRAVLFAEKFGIRIVQVPACDMPKFDPRTEETDHRFFSNMKELTEFAAVHGVMLAIENMENDYMNSVTKCMRMVKFIHSPYFQLYPDAGNIMSAALSEQTNVEADMQAGKGHYAAFHLKETGPNKFGGLFYGEGHVDFPRLVRNAWKLGARRFVMEYWYTGNKEWKKDLIRAREFCESFLIPYSSVMEE